MSPTSAAIGQGKFEEHLRDGMIESLATILATTVAPDRREALTRACSRLGVSRTGVEKYLWNNSICAGCAHPKSLHDDTGRCSHPSALPGALRSETCLCKPVPEPDRW